MSEQRIRDLIGEPKDMTLLEACRIGIGFKKCRILADEYILIDEEQYKSGKKSIEVI